MPLSSLPHAIIRHSGEVRGTPPIPVPWWSITKTVLATAVLKLTETGAFRLDDPYDDWPFTIRHLLQHTSGLTTYGGPAYQKAVTGGEPVWSVEDLLTRHIIRQLLFTPGAGWAYSNIGYLFVRHLIEHTTKVPLDSALQRLIFTPLGITRTHIATTASEMAHTSWGNPMQYDPRWVFHGLLIGPPTDAVAFLDGLLAGRILSALSLDTMQDQLRLGGPLPRRPWAKTGYGLGVMMGDVHGVGRVVGHSGVGHDSVSALYAFLDLPGRPVVSAFAPGTDEGIVEHEAVRLALTD